MIDVLTAIFAGAMIVLAPVLLLRSIRDIQEKAMAVAWVVLALFAWGASVWLLFAAPLWAPLGILIGAAAAFMTRAKPDFTV